MTKKKDLSTQTFRAETAKYILQTVGAGDSCSIVGIGSVGKSNLLRLLQQPDTHRLVSDDLTSYLFIYVDLNKALKNSTWGLLELMLHQMTIALTNYDIDEVVLNRIETLHQTAMDQKSRALVLRYLDQALNLVCNRLNLKVVFLIDEFDELCRTMSRRGFAALRALRDEYKYKLMYVVATRLALNRLREETIEIEPFEELLTSHLIWLGPYSDQDARIMMQRLMNRHQIKLSKKVIDEVLKVTGRHSGLLREGFTIVSEQPKKFFERLAENSQVNDECQRIWLSLSPKEQQTMVNLTNQNATLSERSMSLLRQKGLVNEKEVIFSPLFSEYIKRRHPLVGARIHLDRRRHTVSVNGHEIRDLTRLEFSLIDYLEANRNQVCTRDNIIKHMYSDEEQYDGISENRLDTVIRRVRKKIEPNPKEPQYIVTVWGVGFQLADGEQTQNQE